jgi:acyl CoA:acetate/3-ketoacid CoA transferase beta subunit
MALDKNQIAKRIAKELKHNYYVNLGIGIPTLVANYIPEVLMLSFKVMAFLEWDHSHLKGTKMQRRKTNHNNITRRL